VTSSSLAARRGYHHGDLRFALIRAASEIIGEVGVANFSVAAAARRVGVSSGAPYRHFPDREGLLAAVAVGASKQIIERYQQAMRAVDDPVEQLVGAAVAYVHVASEAGAGFGVVYSDEIDVYKHRELLAYRQDITDLMLKPCLAVAPSYEDAIELVEAYGSLVHGYAPCCAIARSAAEGTASTTVSPPRRAS
jgi:AcrR family transcriptional regulator